MRRYRWLFAVAGLVVVSFFLFNRQERAEASDGAVTLARRAAIQGLNETARRLVADPMNWSSQPDKYVLLNASLEGAQYSTEVASPYRTATVDNGCSADTVDVVSTAAIEDGDSHRIEATYVRTCGGDVGIRLVDFSEK